MSRLRTIVGSFVVVALVWSGLAWAGPAEDAAKSFSQGNDLLAKADFDAALKAYATAARTDGSKNDYRQQYSLLRRVISLREALATEKNAGKWETTARALREFYHANKVYSEALSLDQQIHAKLDSAESAIMLAQSQLAADKNEDAEKLLSGLNEKKITAHSRVLLAVAMARQGKVDQAKPVLEKCLLTKDDQANPTLLFDQARAKTLVGDSDGALAALSRSLEMTRPSQLEATRLYAKNSKDFEKIAQGPGFATALKTESKVKESGCSGGASCGSCKSKGSCSQAGGTAASCKEALAEKK